MNMSALRKHVISSTTEQRLISHGLTLSIEKDLSAVEKSDGFTVVSLKPSDSSLHLTKNRKELLSAVEKHVDAICQEEWNCLAKDVFWKPVFNIGMGRVSLSIL